MRALAVVAAVSVLVAGSMSLRAQSSDVRAAIEAQNRKFEAGWAAKNAQAVADLYTADARLMPPNASTVNGGQPLLEFWKAGLAAVPGPIKLTTVELEVHGDVAHEIGTFQMTAADGKVADKGKYVVIWKRMGGQWKLHRDIWNSDGPAAGM